MKMRGEEIAAFSKGKKAIVYLATTFAGFSVYLLLSKLDNRGSFIVDFGEGTLSFNEWIAFLPLASIGAIVGFFYFKLEFTLEKLIHPFREYKLTLGIIGGILLGIAGTFLPYTLFSGEHQLKELVVEWSHLSFLDTTSFRDFKVVHYCRLFEHRVARWTYLPNYIFWVKYRIRCSIYSSYRSSSICCHRNNSNFKLCVTKANSYNITITYVFPA